MKRLTLLLAALAAPALASAQSSTWDFDPAHNQATFTVRHMGVSNVRGEFQKMAGKLVLDEKDVTKSTVEATIEVASVNTRVQKRDDDLRSDAFFNAAKNPAMTFVSTKVEKAGAGKLKVTGNLTMNGITKPVVLDVAGPTPPIAAFGRTIRGVSASTTISRKDWSLNWNKLIEATPIVGDEVKVELEVELVKNEPKK